MNCPEYIDLTIMEQYQLIGKAVHLLQSNSIAFSKITEMVRIAEKKGAFVGITINPAPDISNKEIDNQRD